MTTELVYDCVHAEYRLTGFETMLDGNLYAFPVTIPDAERRKYRSVRNCEVFAYAYGIFDVEHGLAVKRNEIAREFAVL